MTKCICTTTIYPKGEALEKFDYIAGRDGWTLIVAGDLKTPNDIKLKNGIYLSPRDQEKMDKKLSDLIGFNNIQRRNFSFLYAKKLGSLATATCDDDNIPYDNWGQDLGINKPTKFTRYLKNDVGVFDPIYGEGSYRHLWHRGFPLQLVHKREYVADEVTDTVDIAASFWDGDPDIDAIERMIYNPECKFRPERFPFISEMLAPFNSQNTIVSDKVLPHYFVLPHVGRGDDIINSYYVQALGFKVGYFAPTVYQARNPQNLTKNMENEYGLYSNILTIIKDLQKSPHTLFNHIPERSAEAFKQYQTHFE